MARIVKIWCKYSAKNKNEEAIELTAETQIDDGEQPYKVAQDVIRWLKATVNVELGSNVSGEVHSAQNLEEVKEEFEIPKSSTKWASKLEQNIK